MKINFGLLILFYGVCYALMSGLLKHLHDPMGVLPVSVYVSTLAWFAYLIASGSWRLMRFRDPLVWVCAAGAAAILISSNVVYSLPTVSILFPLLLMKGGGLPMAPLIDWRWPDARTWLVLALAAAGLFAGSWQSFRTARAASMAALACVAWYLGGYALKLTAVGRRRGDWGFFLSETTATLALSVVCVCALRFLAPDQWRPSRSWLAIVAGLASQGCGVGSLILMRGGSAEDKARGLDSHARLMPLHRSVAVIAGLVATATLALAARGSAAVWAFRLDGEVVGAALMIAALAVGLRRPASTMPSCAPSTEKTAPASSLAS